MLLEMSYLEKIKNIEARPLYFFVSFSVRFRFNHNILGDLLVFIVK